MACWKMGNCTGNWWIRILPNSTDMGPFLPLGSVDFEHIHAIGMHLVITLLAIFWHLAPFVQRKEVVQG